jgi:Nucleotide modification associated domain 2
MPTLFSYCIPYDDGAAPNPFWGLCTLAICKPIIRRVAKEGDWIVGTGSVNSPIRDISGKVVYAMRVTGKMTMRGYDQFTSSELPNKIPQMDHTDPRRWYGDSIYDFSTFPPPLRPSVHGEGNRSTDLHGSFVLLSDHFFYFGDQPIALPEALLGIVKQGQGHRSDKNAEYVDAFVDWIESLKSKYPLNEPIGNPQWWSKQNAQASCSPCATGRQQETEADLAEPDAPCGNPS